VSLVSQNPYSQLVYGTVRGNIAAALKLGTGRPCVSAEQGAVLLGLDSLMEREISALSFGEAQKTALLCAVLYGPEVLIIDEPLFSLDNGSMLGVERIMSDFAGSGGAVALISHIPEFLDKYCGKIFSME